jgi:elongation factor P--beta-lysine ligase
MPVGISLSMSFVSAICGDPREREACTGLLLETNPETALKQLLATLQKLIVAVIESE